MRWKSDFLSGRNQNKAEVHGPFTNASFTLDPVSRDFRFKPTRHTNIVNQTKAQIGNGGGGESFNESASLKRPVTSVPQEHPRPSRLSSESTGGAPTERYHMRTNPNLARPQSSSRTGSRNQVIDRSSRFDDSGNYNRKYNSNTDVTCADPMKFSGSYLRNNENIVNGSSFGGNNIQESISSSRNVNSAYDSSRWNSIDPRNTFEPKSYQTEPSMKMSSLVNNRALNDYSLLPKLLLHSKSHFNSLPKNDNTNNTISSYISAMNTSSWRLTANKWKPTFLPLQSNDQCKLLSNVDSREKTAFKTIADIISQNNSNAYSSKSFTSKYNTLPIERFNSNSNNYHNIIKYGKESLNLIRSHSSPQLTCNLPSPALSSYRHKGNDTTNSYSLKNPSSFPTPLPTFRSKLHEQPNRTSSFNSTSYLKSNDIMVNSSHNDNTSAKARCLDVYLEMKSKYLDESTDDLVWDKYGIYPTRGSSSGYNPLRRSKSNCNWCSNDHNMNRNNEKSHNVQSSTDGCHLFDRKLRSSYQSELTRLNNVCRLIQFSTKSPFASSLNAILHE